MWTIFCGVVLLLHGILGAPISLCPKSCNCKESGVYLETYCHSLDFIQKRLSVEQIASLTTLVINNGSVIKTNPNLSNLSHLRRLSLTRNKIQHITTAHLPKSLEYLDLSSNFIKHPPEDLSLLRNLSEINLTGNPISCDCNSIFVRDGLLERGVVLKKPVTCNSPAEHFGRSWFTVKCKEHAVQHIFDEMQGDAPYEGSGSGDISLIAADETHTTTEKWDGSIENEFIPVSSGSPEFNAVSTEAPELEGSGDEQIEATTLSVAIFDESQTTINSINEDDYEDEDYVDETSTAKQVPVTTEAVVTREHEPRLKACNFNCSTPTPIENSNETALAVGVLDGAKILFGDIFGIRETTTTTESHQTSTVVEDHINKIDRNTLTKGRAINLDDKKSEAEVIQKEVNEAEKSGSISEPPQKQSNTTFIFLAVLLLIIICLVIYAVVKKRSMKRNRRPVSRHPEAATDGPGEEMKLLKKVPDSDKPNGTHEKIPLMNGNQHKNNEDVSAQEPKDNGLKPTEDNEDVELRPKKLDQEILLTPETKRVTIKASEIPNSTPKTPILVIRHKNSDGTIVTTPNVEQHVK